MRETRAPSPGPLEHSWGYCDLGGYEDFVTGHKFISRKEPLANGGTGIRGSVSE